MDKQSYKIIGNSVTKADEKEYLCDNFTNRDIWNSKTHHFATRHMTKLLHNAILIICLLLSVPSVAQEMHPKYEYRAVWLTTIENLDWPKSTACNSKGFAQQREELTTLLDSLKEMHVNTILLQTRVRGDLIYPSRIEPFSHVFTGTTGKSPDYDPLAFAIEECHKRGMQLHAWLVTLPLGKDEHIRRQGKQSIVRQNRELCTHYKEHWYMEPGNPETADYITDIVKEIVRNYDVDGIHLDYIRYPDRTEGYPDAALHRKHGRDTPLPQWRRRNITDIVRKVYSSVKQEKPWVRVSCAPLGKHNNLRRYSSLGWDAYNTVFQEVQEWMKEGIMDIIFPMLYFNGNNFYPFVRDWQENSNGRHVVPGIGIYRLMPEYGNWSPIEIERQINTSREAGTAGTAMFRAEHIKGAGSKAYRRTNRTPALIPPMTWAPGAAPATPKGVEVTRDDKGITIRWDSITGNTDEPSVKYNVYCAIDQNIDINNIKELVATQLCCNSYRWNCRTLKTMTVAVTSVDAYGRESEPAIVTCYNNSNIADKEIPLPPAPSWGARVEVIDIWGRKVYSGRYFNRIGVRGLQDGHYIIRMYDRHGALLYTRHFFTKEKKFPACPE